MATVVTGWGLSMIRIRTWGRAAGLAKAGLKPPGATLRAWREQFGSSARTWAQVAQEADELVAVHTMARLLATCAGTVACSTEVTES